MFETTLGLLEVFSNLVNITLESSLNIVLVVIVIGIAYFLIDKIIQVIGSIILKK